MNVGIITNLGSKGQIVIPSGMRKTLGVSPDDPLSISLVGGGIYIQPVDCYPKNLATDDGAFLAFLAKYRGIWGPETPEEKKQRSANKKKEIKRAKDLAKIW